MNKLSLCSLLVIALASQQTYATERTFAPIKADGQVIADSYGVSFVSQQGKAIDISVGYIPDTSSTGWLQVFVRNNGWQPVYFSEQSLTLEARNEGVIKVYTYDELTAGSREQIAAENKRHKNRKIGLGLLMAFAGSGAPNAGYGTATSTYNGRVTNQYGQSNEYRGTITTQTYDPVAAQAASDAADRRNAQIIANEKKRNQEALDAIREQNESSTTGLLQAGSIDTGQTIGGKIRISLPQSTFQGNEMQLKLTFPGESFVIRYQEIVGSPQ